MIVHKEEKKVVGPRHMLKYTGPINRALVEQGVKRTSNLLAPIMLLEGLFYKNFYAVFLINVCRS